MTEIKGEEFRTQPERDQVTLAQKNAALWLHYSHVFVHRNSASGFIDNGGHAPFPVRGTVTPRNSAEREYSKNIGR